MNYKFVLQDNSPYNSLITQPDGTQLYRLLSEPRFFGSPDTIIFKYQYIIGNNLNQANMGWQPIGSIKRGAFQKPEVSFGVPERPMNIGYNGFLSRSISFWASDNRKCKWKVEGSFFSAQHKLYDQNYQELASFKSPGLIDTLGGAHASLSIAPAGISIMDEIIVSFAFAEALRRERKKAAASSAATAGTANAASAAAAASAASC